MVSEKERLRNATVRSVRPDARRKSSLDSRRFTHWSRVQAQKAHRCAHCTESIDHIDYMLIRSMSWSSDSEKKALYIKSLEAKITELESAGSTSPSVLQSRIETLEAENSELKAEIERLKQVSVPIGLLPFRFDDFPPSPNPTIIDSPVTSPPIYSTSAQRSILPSASEFILPRRIPSLCILFEKCVPLRRLHLGATRPR